MGSRDDNFPVWKRRQLTNRRLAWVVHDSCFILEMTYAHSQALDINIISCLGLGNLGYMKALILETRIYKTLFH